MPYLPLPNLFVFSIKQAISSQNQASDWIGTRQAAGWNLLVMSLPIQGTARNLLKISYVIFDCDLHRGILVSGEATPKKQAFAWASGRLLVFVVVDLRARCICSYCWPRFPSSLGSH